MGESWGPRIRRDDRGAGSIGDGKVLRRTRTTSIALSEDLITKLRAKGAKRGLGYQTLLKMIVMEHVDEY